MALSRRLRRKLAHHLRPKTPSSSKHPSDTDQNTGPISGDTSGSSSPHHEPQPDPDTLTSTGAFGVTKVAEEARTLSSDDAPSVLLVDFNATAFGTLAPELRNQIYELALYDSNNVDFKFSNTTTWSLSRRSQKRHRLALTETCKAIRAECALFFFTINHFTLSDVRAIDHCGPPLEVDDFCAYIGRVNAAALRSVNIAFGVCPRPDFSDASANQGTQSTSVEANNILVSTKLADIVLEARKASYGLPACVLKAEFGIWGIEGLVGRYDLDGSDGSWEVLFQVMGEADQDESWVQTMFEVVVRSREMVEAKDVAPQTDAEAAVG